MAVRPSKLRKPKNTAHNLRVIRKAREARGWTQSKLCERTGLSYNTVAFAERGGVCSSSTAAKLTKALGVTVKPASVGYPKGVKPPRHRRTHEEKVTQELRERINELLAQHPEIEEIARHGPEALADGEPIPVFRDIGAPGSGRSDDGSQGITDSSTSGSGQMGQPDSERNEARDGAQPAEPVPGN